MQPPRRIASNLLWTPRQLVRNPLLVVAPDGHFCITTCDAPDREACVEFYAGVLVPDFPEDFNSAFARMKTRDTRPLPELLDELFEELPVPEKTTLVVISGLDYDTLRLTPASCIRKIG